MDTGVALITLNSGMSGRKARPWVILRGLKAQVADILFSFKENLVTLCAGFFRFLLLSELDYQGHASEYGIHWNFYSTISLINIFQSFVRNPKHAFLMALSIMTIY